MQHLDRDIAELHDAAYSRQYAMRRLVPLDESHNSETRTPLESLANVASLALTMALEAHARALQAVRNERAARVVEPALTAAVRADQIEDATGGRR